ncbi:MAG: hypothetical protein CVU18_06095 [Betaproteobacteria bacterium HGW-Betaproteobacteria-12]|nr:MAG: hypothetical protein CVU18_06095 [Betaproteobacteria bacterium HGW-Betaproteobacteria-12]
MADEQVHDPLNFMRNLWGNMGFTLPGMVAPTFDIDELDKRIKDMKAVEGWLRMNLSMLQMTIQGLEMQRTTVSTVQAMGEMASKAAKSMTPEAAEPAPAAAPEATAFSEAAMWPWQMMQQMREQMQQTAEAAVHAASEEKPASKPASRRAKGSS